ncbi:MAG TPA: hypothetical protein VF868_12915 [Bacteroidia bacterium]|jgi:hypothetical protein
MYSRVVHSGLIFLLCFSFFTSCKKEKDETGPKVTFTSPFENQTFAVHDYIPVKASISDETEIVSASITLVDLNYIPVQESLVLQPSSHEMWVSADYELSNIHLESGKYYLMILASDGKNDSRTFRAVMITGVPRVLKSILVASSSSSSVTNLSMVDSSFSSLNLFRSFGGDFLGTSSSSYDQRVFMCGSYTGAFTGIKLENNSVILNIPPQVSSVPYFTGYMADDKKLYVARYDEQLFGYNNSGMNIYSARANNGYYIRKMIMNNGYLLAEEKNKFFPGDILVSFYTTGTYKQQVALSQEVAAFCEKDEHRVFVFGNSSGQGVIQLYDRVYNTISNPYNYSLAPGLITCAVKIDHDTYLVGHSNGTVYKYQYQNSSVTTFASGYSSKELKYDQLNNDIYVVESNRITVIDYNSGSVINSVSSAENILGISLLYNR